MEGEIVLVIDVDIVKVLIWMFLMVINKMIIVYGIYNLDFVYELVVVIGLR